ncbi:subtilase family protein, partial [Vibrio parahaemolyticus V-223/04]
FVKHRNY